MITAAVIRERPGMRMPEREVRRIAALVCRRERVRTASFSIVLTGDRTIARLHRKHFGDPSVTDVITFPLDVGRFEAEIYIDVDQARRQALRYGVTLRDELTRLVVHGILHTLGYDDRTPAKRAAMFAVQERYVRAAASVSRKD